MDVPLLSVCLITYNHKDYISEAIEGVLMQKTNFKIELIIADDCSTDGTINIINKYREENPALIRIIQQKNNIGPARNWLELLNSPSSMTKYISYFEGDDYWTDPLKLQKQVDLLEANPNLVACHHWQKNAVFKDGKFIEIKSPKKGHGYFPKKISSVNKIFINDLRIKSRTILFRNVINNRFFPFWICNVAFGDVPLTFLLGKYGDFGFIDEEMAVYRQTGAGVSTAGMKEMGFKNFKVQHMKNWIEIWDYADIHYNFKYHKESKKTVTEFYNSLLINLQFSIPSFLGILKYNIIDRKLSFFKTLSHTKLIILFFTNKISKKVKRKLSFN